jgi:sugar fermentation stimulation protein A
MQFREPLIRGALLRRYKRFFADVQLAGCGSTITAHCPNSGSMLSVDAPGSEVWLSRADNPARKLGFTWEIIRVGDVFVGINTSRPNSLVAEAVNQGRVPELASYPILRREVRYGANSRIDLLLAGDDRPPCFVEVKNVTLRRTPGATAPLEFPDAVTARGTKHARELISVVRQGGRGVLLFLAQRGDGQVLAIAHDIDPKYAEALREAVAAGVETLCYGCAVSPERIDLARRLPIALPS